MKQEKEMLVANFCAMYSNNNKSEKGNWYNLYSQRYTDIHDAETCNDLDLRVEVPNDKVVRLNDDKKEIAEEVVIKLLA